MTTRASLCCLIVAALALVTGCSAGRQSTWEATPTQTTKAAGDSFEALMQKGEAAWVKRSDRQVLAEALAAWEQAAALKPDDALVYAKLARGYYFLADGFLRASPAEYQATFEKSVSFGERGMAAANPKFKEHVVAGGKVEDGMQYLTAEAVQVESAYWYAAALGKWARSKGFATTLGNKDRIKGVMERLLALDTEASFGPTGFFHGAIDRYFGSFYAVAPGFAGGDMEKSKSHFERSLTKAPYYPGTRVLYADTYAVKKGDRALFERLLNEVLTLPDSLTQQNEDLSAETKVEKEKAKEMLAKADELF